MRITMPITWIQATESLLGLTVCYSNLVRVLRASVLLWENLVMFDFDVATGGRLIEDQPEIKNIPKRYFPIKYYIAYAFV